MKHLYILCLFLVLTVNAQTPTDRDPEFNLYNLPLNNYFVNVGDVRKILLQADEQLLVIDDDGKLFRMQDNNLDTGFNTETGVDEEFNSIAVQSDGKIIAVGNFTTYNGAPIHDIVRLNSDGSKDPTFTSGFSSASYSEISEVAIQPDGKILIAGVFSSYSGVACKNVIRLNTNGTLDYSFNIGTGLSSNGSIISIKIQTDGKVLMAGNFSTFNNASANNVIRVNANGAIDTGFIIGSGFSGQVNKLVVQPDGKIIAGGVFSGYNGTESFNVARLNSNGTIDNGFISEFTNLGNDVKDIVIQADGKIIVGGYLSQYDNISVNHLVRLNADGTKDLSHVTGAGFDSAVGTMALKNDGKVIVAGSFLKYKGVAVDGIVRINTDGSKDMAFNNQGAGFNRIVSMVVMQPDGKMLVSGYFTSYNGSTVNHFLRLNGDGSIDTTFNIGTGIPFGMGTNYINVIKPLANGKILVGGNFTTYNGTTVKRLIRLNSNGTLDTTFNNTNGANATVTAIDVQADGKIIVGGDFLNYASYSCSGVVRLNENGTLDTSFNISGSYNYSGSVPNIYSVAVLSNQSILVGGNFNSYNSLPVNGIVRLFSTGLRDTTFVLDATIAATAISHITPRPDGKIMIAANSNIGLRRINSNGSLDNSFTFSQAPSTIIRDYAVQPDGKVIIGGYFTNTSPSLGYFKRLNVDGTTDAGFDSTVNLNESVYGVTLQSDGKIIVFGEFSEYEGIVARRIVRLIGNTFYAIQGTNRFDGNANGCDPDDTVFPNVNIQVAGSANSNFITNITGNYNFGFLEGSYTISPILENPDYFTVTPPSITVSFPDQSAPVIQDFCIAANGIHNDLEITVIPETSARPGADSYYRLVYKNKGNQVQSGSITLNFPDEVMDLISATPIASSQSPNVLTWDFSNLLPLETRIIIFGMNLNTPNETPANNMGDILQFNSVVTSVATDETPIDNSSILNQTVVNSFDPNDKTCIEGNTVGTEKIGDFVHYVIRFENSGTASAINITISDLIDTNKYDISSLLPINGSHDFVTRITDLNKVEFVFENINLPFNDADNDGFVAFKIKLLSTLVEGDSFSNSAAIFFDYNSAIITNTATTTIQSLATDDFEFSNYFSLYPVPAAEVLNIFKKQDIRVNSMSVYNMVGQIVMVITNANDVQSLDISNLTKGNYFMKISTDKGLSVSKFVKL